MPFPVFPLIVLLLANEGAASSPSASRALDAIRGSSLRVRSLGVTMSTFPAPKIGDGLAVFTPGDLSRSVQVYDYDRNTIVDTGLEARGLLHARPFGAFVLGAVPEAEIGSDLNGDGDTADCIAALFHPRANETSYLGAIPNYTGFFSGEARIAETFGGTLALELGEGEEGATDRNADGDTTDVVVTTLRLEKENRLRDLGSSSPPAIPLSLRNVLLPSTSEWNSLFYFPPESSFTLSREHLLLGVAENSIGLGVDLNGDGDAQDYRVLHAFPVNGGSPRNLGVEIALDIRKLGTDVGVLVPEGAQGEDLNEDGDLTDLVFHLWKDDQASLVNTRTPARTFVELKTLWRLDISERDVAQDLNGDGDLLDVIDHVFDGATGTLHNLSVQATRTVEAGPVLLLTVNEAANGGQDLNGDGDAADHVLHEYDLEAASLSNRQTALLPNGMPLVSGPRVTGLRVFERDQSADFNFDGDAADSVLGVYDAGNDSYRNLALAIGGTELVSVGRFLFFGVREAGQGNVDLNGDGDTDDEVLHVYDADTGTSVSFGLQLQVWSLVATEDLVFFGVNEQGQGEDLDGDGMLSGTIAFVIDLRDR